MILCFTIFSLISALCMRIKKQANKRARKKTRRYKTYKYGAGVWIVLERCQLIVCKNSCWEFFWIHPHINLMQPASPSYRTVAWFCANQTPYWLTNWFNDQNEIKEYIDVNAWRSLSPQRSAASGERTDRGDSHRRRHQTAYGLQSRCMVRKRVKQLLF